MNSMIAGGLAGLDLTLKARHDRLESVDDLGIRLHHRFRHVSSVDEDAASCPRASPSARRGRARSAPCASCRRSSGTGGSLWPPRRARRSTARSACPPASSGVLPPKPRVVVLRPQGDDLASHDRVTGATELGAIEIERPRVDRLEPQRRVTPRNRIHLQPEGRDVKAVNHVARSNQELDGSVCRNVEARERGLAAGISELPLPLLGDDVDLHGTRGRHGRFHVLTKTHDPPADEEREEAERDGGLEPHRALDAGGAHRRAPGVHARVSVNECQRDQSHERGSRDRDSDDEIMKPVDLARDRRRPARAGTATCETTRSRGASCVARGATARRPTGRPRRARPGRRRA